MSFDVDDFFHFVNYARLAVSGYKSAVAYLNRHPLLNHLPHWTRCRYLVGVDQGRAA